MSGINGLNSNNDTFTSMFGTSSTNNSSSNSFSLLDYASIKNGSYKKLAKTYYAQNNSKSSNLTTEESKEESKKLSTTKSDASRLKNSSAALKNMGSLLEGKEVVTKDADGKETVTKEYDWDKIGSSVKSFVSDYNDMLKNAAETDSKGVLRSAAWLTQITDKSSKLLAEVGISVGSDNQLTLDEEKLKKANVSTLKTLFSEPNSFADKVNAKASQIEKAATSDIAKMMKTYGKNGVYSGVATSGDLYDSIF